MFPRADGAGSGRCVRVLRGLSMSRVAGRSRGAARKTETHRLNHIPLRALTAAVVVAVVTTASHEIGSFVSGMFSVFPIVMGSFAVIMHPRIGGPAAASMFAHAQVPLVGLALGFLAVHYLAQPFGSWWALLVGLAICVAWNAMLWIVKIAKA